MALGRANAFSRFVMCGGISQYNAQSKSGPTVSILEIPESRKFQIVPKKCGLTAWGTSQRNFSNIITQRIKYVSSWRGT